MPAQGAGAVCPDTEDSKECGTYVCPEAPPAATSATQMAPLPSASTSSPPPQAVGVPSSVPVAGSSPTLLVMDAPSASIPKTAAQVESFVGVVYLAIAAPAEALSPSGLAEVRSQLSRHLAQFDARIGDADIALNVLAGSVVLRVALSGDSIDGKKLAKQLEADVASGRLSILVLGYACLALCPPEPQIRQPPLMRTRARTHRSASLHCHRPTPPTPPPPSLPSNKLKEMLRASLQRNDLWHLDPLRADYIAPDQFPIKVSNRYTIECSHATPRVERAHLATNLAAYK